MKVNVSLALLSVLAACVSASTADQKPVVISYPQATADSIVAEAKDAIIKAGGFITHEFNLIKGFAAKAPASILESIQAMDAHDNVLIEEDKVVTVNK